jgi:zinc transport system ATP-binding protein
METKTTKPIAELANVWVWLDGNLALRDVTLTVREGRFIGLMGPNGGGKTTLLKTIAGLIEPDKGEVTIAGPRAKIIGYVPQEENVDPDFPVTSRDVVEMGLLGSPRLFSRISRQDRIRIDSALSRVGMREHASRRIGELSGGQKQRVFIARAIAGEPRLLLLDEPTTGVDAGARDDFYRLLTDLMADLSLTIMLASHDVEVVPNKVDEIICINQQVFVHAPPEEIIDTDCFRQAYGCELQFLMHGRYPHRVIDRHEAEPGDA